jgi:hypothetical protein
MRALVPVVAALVLAMLVLAGCGGDDDSGEAATATTEAPTALSKEELVAQADAVCAEVNAAVGTVGSTSTGAEGQAGQVADLYSGMVERLRGLGAPSDESAGYEEFIGAADQLAQAQSDAALAAERGEDGALATAETEASSALNAFRSAADAFGLEQCGEAPSAPTPTGSSAGEAGGGGSEEEPAGEVAEEVEAAPEVEEEAAPETGGAGSVEEESSGGAGAGGGAEAGGGSGGGSSGGIGPG